MYPTFLLICTGPSPDTALFPFSRSSKLSSAERIWSQTEGDRLLGELFRLAQCQQLRNFKQLFDVCDLGGEWRSKQVNVPQVHNASKFFLTEETMERGLDVLKLHQSNKTVLTTEIVGGNFSPKSSRVNVHYTLYTIHQFYRDWLFLLNKFNLYTSELVSGIAPDIAEKDSSGNYGKFEKWAAQYSAPMPPPVFHFSSRWRLTVDWGGARCGSRWD